MTGFPILEKIAKIVDGRIKIKSAEQADNAAKVNNLTVQTAVPAGAKFTDTVYTHPNTKQCTYNYTHPATKQCNAVIPSAYTHPSTKQCDAAPTANPVFKESISLGRVNTKGTDSFAVGSNVEASGADSHAEGERTRASGSASHAEGYYASASNYYAHAEGRNTTASGSCAHAEGAYTEASNFYAHAEGERTMASGAGAHAEGTHTTASGSKSHVEGFYTTASNFASHAQGKYSREMTTGGADTNTIGDAFVIGNGTSTAAQSNAFRVTYTGAVYGRGSYNSSGADYAEYFEWRDGNPDGEDRRGLFVTLDGEKIRIATAEDDYILGVVSGSPAMVGDSHSEIWKDMYIVDMYGNRMREEVEVAETIDENTGEVIPAHTEIRDMLNLDYDPNQEYIGRENRPEWNAVGMLGKLIVADDGTCIVNGYCKPASEGKATAADTGYRVMERLDDSHIRILYR